MIIYMYICVYQHKNKEGKDCCLCATIKHQIKIFVPYTENSKEPDMHAFA